MSTSETDRSRPLADRMRPRRLTEVCGQQHLLGEGRPLRRALEAGRIPSMVLWGPPGSGKTSLARLLAEQAQVRFVTMSAVLAGVKDIRAVAEQAHKLRVADARDTVLFVDEVHRFNKAQQDAFLPYVEDGTLTLVGATTENPSFELNSALLSRARVFVLKRLQEAELAAVIERALTDPDRGVGTQALRLPDELRSLLARAADGDARRALNVLEMTADLVPDGTEITRDLLVEVLGAGGRRDFDKQGEHFYDQISALHKSIRGSNPDASLYWLARILDGGCDPLYVARRLVRIASEDIGNADPRSLQLALDAWNVQERLGSPEGELALAQAVAYLASAPKSNAVYTAFNEVQKDVARYGSEPVPVHLRNAPTPLMKELGYGKRYRYAHDEPGAYSAGQSYFPEAIGERRYYFPSERGLEARIAEKLEHLRKLDAEHAKEAAKKDQ